MGVEQGHSLQADELLTLAQQRTGLQDFGDSWFLEPLGVMLDALNREAALSAAGVLAHRERIVSGLVNRLRMAGYRGQAPLVVFLFARFVLPFIAFALGLLYFFVIGKFEQPFLFKLGASVLVGAVGFYLPIIYVANVVAKRQQSIRTAWPDALDLILICVESGMSIELAFRKVAEEIGLQSGPLAEELMLTTAELSYLPERRQAYENLALRTGLDGVKGVVTALIQAERYGTPLGDSLRVMAQESRDQRMNEAEKKAAALPPKLTVPMILFFLPVLFVVILGPAIINIQDMMKGG